MPQEVKNWVEIKRTGKGIEVSIFAPELHKKITDGGIETTVGNQFGTYIGWPKNDEIIIVPSQSDLLFQYWGQTNPLISLSGRGVKANLAMLLCKKAATEPVSVSFTGMFTEEQVKTYLTAYLNELTWCYQNLWISKTHKATLKLTLPDGTQRDETPSTEAAVHAE